MRRQRQLALILCSLALVAVAVLYPRDAGDVADATQFSAAFFATILTGEAVIFALSFSAASSWPPLSAIDSHIAFREWVLIGAVATMFTAIGILNKNEPIGTYGALLFLLANGFGVYSFVRLFGLAGIHGRNELLRTALGTALTSTANSREPQATPVQDDPTIAAYLGAVSLAVGTNNPDAIRHLVSQLTTARTPPSAAHASIAVHLDALHQLCRATLVSNADPVVTTACATSLIESLITHARQLPDAAPALGATSRYLAWLGSTAHLMSVRGVAPSRAAREMIALSTDSRLRILRQVDPDPKSAVDPSELGSILRHPLSVLLWIADFTEFHGAHQAGALYGVYEALTGTKFMGNYWDGASVLGQLRDALYSDTDAINTREARSSRQVFGSAREFDRFWALVSVDAIATLRDARQPHPPELIRPEFTPDPQLWGAYLRSFASHRWFTTAEEAREALLMLISRAESPGSPLSAIEEQRQRSDYALPVPRTEPQRRPAAMILAIACRLAPLSPEESDSELRAFLTELPPRALHAAASLASRALPGTADETDPVETIAQGLKTLQLVGSHLRAGQ